MQGQWSFKISQINSNGDYDQIFYKKDDNNTDGPFIDQEPEPDTVFDGSSITFNVNIPYISWYQPEPEPEPVPEPEPEQPQPEPEPEPEAIIGDYFDSTTNKYTIN